MVNSHKVFDLLKNYRDFNNYINEFTIKLETWKTEKNNIEIDLEEERTLKEVHMKKIDVIQADYNELAKELAQKEERLVNLCQNLSTKEKLIEEKTSELSEIVQELENRSKRQEELKTRKEELLESNEEAFDHEELEEEVENLKEQYQDRKEALSELQERVNSLRDEINQQGNDQFKMTGRLTELAGQLEDVTKEMEGLEEQFSSMSKEVQQEREDVKLKEELAEEFQERLRDAKQNYLDKKPELQELELAHKELEKQFLQIDAELNGLEKIKSSMEGAGKGVQKFLEESGNDSWGLLSELVRCPDEYTAAISVLASQYDQILFADEEKAKEWWSSNTELKLGVFSSANEEITTNTELIERIKLNGATSVTPVLDILEVSEEIKPLLKSLWSNVFIVDGDVSGISNELGFDGIVALNGSMIKIKNQGQMVSILGANIGSENSAIERNNRIDQLTAEKDELEQQVSIKKEAVDELTAELEELNSQLEILQTEAQQKKEDALTARAKLDSKLSGHESGQQRLEILSNRKSAISKERLELMEKEEEVSNTLSENRSELEDLEESFEESQEVLQDVESQYHEKRDYLFKISRKKSFSAQIQSFDDQILDINDQLDRLNKRQTSAKDWIENTETELEENEKEISVLETSNLEKAKELEEKTDALSFARDELEKIVTQMQDREEKVKVLSKDIATNEKQIIEKNLKIEQIIVDEEQITRDVFERYQIDLREVISSFLEMDENETSNLVDLSAMYFIETESGQKEIEKEEYTFNRRFGQDLKDVAQRLRTSRSTLSQLGEINWQAIEDYDRQKLRFDFLVDQENELKQSLEDLTVAIEKIDKKSIERFKVAFQEVNNKFTQVFPIIFGGGEARLELKGSFEDPDAGVDIIAKPPGKRMVNINLMSGGEKAMTAVGLIFAVFLVKPSPFCLLDEVDAPLDDANVGRFSELLREMSKDSQFILITHNKKTMELNDTLYGVTMQEPGVSKALSVQLQ